MGRHRDVDKPPPPPWLPTLLPLHDASGHLLCVLTRKEARRLLRRRREAEPDERDWETGLVLSLRLRKRWN